MNINKVLNLNESEHVNCNRYNIYYFKTHSIGIHIVWNVYIKLSRVTLISNNKLMLNPQYNYFNEIHKQKVCIVLLCFIV